MADIRIDKARAERIVALVLREEGKMLPDRANAMAALLTTRLQAAMAMPTKPGMRRYRMISRLGRDNGRDDLVEAFRSLIPDADNELVRDIWNFVYDRCRDLPDDVVV